MANITTSTVTFSILSPDVSLSYDRIKLRLEEYRNQLAADSDTIELSTENEKAVICQKQAKEMREYLDQAELLLRDVVQSRDISTVAVLRHLLDLARILDDLKLYDECRLTGNCAFDLAEALVRRSHEFRQEQVETLVVIAELSVYQPRARTLFTQAISICEEVVADTPSHSNKFMFFHVLDRAGHCTSGYLGAQWVGRAIQLMTEELPPTIVHPDFRAAMYNNYGVFLRRLERHADAIGAYHEAISICRTLANNNPAKYNVYLARTLMNIGISLWNFGKYDDAVVVYKEALEICTTMSAQDPLRYNELMAVILLNYGLVLFWTLNQVSEAAEVQKQAILLLRNHAQLGGECTKLLSDALYSYGRSCNSLGLDSEALPAYQESILLRRSLAATDPEEEKTLVAPLHYIGHSFLALGRYAEANTAAIEALERNHGRVFEGCPCAVNFQLYHYQSAVKADPPGDSLLPLPLFPAGSSPRPVERSGAGAFHPPAESFISVTSPHIPRTNTARQLGLGQPGMVPEALFLVHLDPTTPSPSFPPSNQPPSQEPKDPSTRTPKHIGETVKVSVYRKRDRILGLFRGNRSQ